MEVEGGEIKEGWGELLHKGKNMCKEAEKPYFVGVFQERARYQKESEEKYIWRMSSHNSDRKMQITVGVSNRKNFIQRISY